MHSLYSVQTEESASGGRFWRQSTSRRVLVLPSTGSGDPLGRLQRGATSGSEKSALAACYAGRFPSQKSQGLDLRLRALFEAPTVAQLGRILIIMVSDSREQLNIIES